MSLAEFVTEVDNLRIDTEMTEVPVVRDRRHRQLIHRDPSPSPLATK